MTRDIEASGALTDRELDALLGADAPRAPEPSLALLNRILADAAETNAARLAGTAAAGGSARPGPRRRLADWLRPVGGWGGAAALASCASLGLWLGMAGGAVVTEDVTEDFAASGVAGAAGSFDSPADAVEAFYNLASADG